jgi:hypothetical protein
MEGFGGRTYVCNGSLLTWEWVVGDAVTLSTERKYRFSGHQTFVFRHGWLEKGGRAVERCPTIFLRDDALVQFGVGKNMVESIKHWCIVCQIIEEYREAGKPAYRLTSIGKKLLFEWDPYLEDDASLWLIHWLLTTNPRIGTTWQLLFGEFFRPDFSKRELTEYILSIVAKRSLTVQESSLHRDIDCFVRSYLSPGSPVRQTISEESFDCPLLALNLLQLCPDGEMYRFNIGPKPSLPTSIFAYALNEYFNQFRGAANTLSVQECLYGAGSPGQVFKLDENSLLQYVEDMEKLTRSGVLFDDTAGIKQIYRRRSFDPVKVLDRYYQAEAR